MNLLCWDFSRPIDVNVDVFYLTFVLLNFELLIFVRFLSRHHYFSVRKFIKTYLHCFVDIFHSGIQVVQKGM